MQRTHLLVPWSRIGSYPVAEMDRLLWDERKLFHYFAHAASLVLTEDYPIHQVLMRRYGTGESLHARRTREWVEANRPLRRHIVAELRRNGRMRTGDFSDNAVNQYLSSGWNTGRNVDRMLDFLWTKGIVMIAGRDRLQRVWDLSERWLPSWTPRKSVTRREATRRSVQKSLRALGVGTARHIRDHFTRNMYHRLDDVLAELVRKKVVVHVRVADGERELPGPWLLHADDLPLLERLQAGDWEPRTTLLSPFDNLICDRRRTELLFGFDYRMEIYVPKDKRRYGYYVLPILHGDGLIGRIDAAMDRAAGRLTIKGVWAEPGAPDGRAAGDAIAEAVEDLAMFLGAGEIDYPSTVPDGWRRYLR